jgi:hypothetical protein
MVQQQKENSLDMIHKVCLGLLAPIVVGAWLWAQHMHQIVKQTPLAAKLEQIVKVTHEPVLDCMQMAGLNPVVILILGQSNAANHGERDSATQTSVSLIADSKCILATNPLPGGTGRGDSIWSYLPVYLLHQELQRPLVLSIIGVDATSIADWTDDYSPLQHRLTNHIKSMKALGLLPTLILWHHGEADAQLGTTSVAYAAGLTRLAEVLSRSGADAPIVAALSTICRSLPSAVIREAIFTQSSRDKRFIVGPDTDRLNDVNLRIDGCHFSAPGLRQAAQFWAKELQLILPITKRPASRNPI